jgi:hypothetical protein
MLNSTLKRKVFGTGIAVAVLVAITLPLAFTAHNTNRPARATRASVACRVWAADVPNAKVTAAYQGTARSFLAWVESATYDAGTVHTVRSEGNVPMAVCYLSGSSFPAPNISGGRPYTHIVSI